MIDITNFDLTTVHAGSDFSSYLDQVNVIRRSFQWYLLEYFQNV